mmetsp:Transcript_25997/g.24839  ORF Transcript_25997/g.24839 Transcript_25997/m.24839 type:complete len:101 (-) Transcript_25997:106-408(-)
MNDTGDCVSPTTKKFADPRNGGIVKNPDNNYADITTAGHVDYDTFTYEVCNAYIIVRSSAILAVKVILSPKANDNFDEIYVDVYSINRVTIGDCSITSCL